MKFVKLKDLTLLAKEHDPVVKSQPSSPLKEDVHKKGESQCFAEQDARYFILNVFCVS